MTRGVRLGRVRLYKFSPYTPIRMCMCGAAVWGGKGVSRRLFGFAVRDV